MLKNVEKEKLNLPEIDKKMMEFWYKPGGICFQHIYKHGTTMDLNVPSMRDAVDENGKRYMKENELTKAIRLDTTRSPESKIVNLLAKPKSQYVPLPKKYKVFGFNCTLFLHHILSIFKKPLLTKREDFLTQYDTHLSFWPSYRHEWKIKFLNLKLGLWYYPRIIDESMISFNIWINDKPKFHFDGKIQCIKS